MPQAMKYQTIYDPQPVQMLFIHNIKTPILEAFDILFSPDSSLIAKGRALKNAKKAFNTLSNLPRPSLEDTWHPNSHNLIHIREYLIRNLRLAPIRMNFIDNIFKLAIMIYEYDCPWRWIMDSAREKSEELEWKERGYYDDWQDGYDWWNNLP